MKIRTLAVCEADFPDDSVETEDGKNFLDYGGQNVAVALAEILSRMGCPVSKPESAGELGWRFKWIFKRQLFFCQVTLIPPNHYLLFEAQGLFQGLSPRITAAHAEIVAAINAELAQDRRFRNVLWYSRGMAPASSDDAIGAADPRAPEPRKPSPPIVRPRRTTRPVLFLVGWIGAIVAATVCLFGSFPIGLPSLLVSAILLLAGSGTIMSPKSKNRTDSG